MLTFLLQNWKIPGALMGGCVLLVFLEHSLAMKRKGVVTPGDKSRIRSILKTGGVLAAIAYGVLFFAS